MTDHDQYLIRTRYTAELDEDRLDEWLAANYEDEYVEVVDRKSGDIVKFHNDDPIPFICPECGELAFSITTSSGTKTYAHGTGDTCEVEL